MTCADPSGRRPLGDRRAISADPRLDPCTTVWASTDAGFGDLASRCVQELIAHRDCRWRTADGNPLLPPLDLPASVRAVAIHGNVIVTAAGADIAVHQPALPQPSR